MVGPTRPVFVLFGSSIVQMSYDRSGWGAILADIYSRRADILLRGYLGWNSRRAVNVLDQIFPKDAAVKPSLVIVYFGGNDSMGPHPSGLGPHVPLPEYIENMRKIASHLKNLSDSTRIIFLSCPPVNEAIINGNIRSGSFSEMIRTNELCQQYSEACIKLCQEINVTSVDLFTAVQRKDDWMNACFTCAFQRTYSNPLSKLLAPLGFSCEEFFFQLIAHTLPNPYIWAKICLISSLQRRFHSVIHHRDGIHFSAEGSKIVVEEILKVLREADWKPSLHWKSMPIEFSEDSPYDIAAADGKTTFNPSSSTFYWEIQWD